MPVLARKPGALRNGAPFKDWLLPASLERVRRKLKGCDDGDRQMVAILSAVLSDGLAAVEAACAKPSTGRPLRRRDHQHPGAQTRSGAGADDPDPGGAAAAPRSRGRLRPLRQPQEGKLMERGEILDLMGTLKLYGMRARL